MAPPFRNAVWELCKSLEPSQIKERLVREKRQGTSVAALASSYELDLVPFLNHSTPAELRRMCQAKKMAEAQAPRMRHRLWSWAAHYERMGLAAVDSRIQPAPALKGSQLVLPTRKSTAAKAVLPVARHARFPEAEAYPRQVPESVEEPFFWGDPQDLDDLLVRANALVGVRLGSRGRDKGFYGQRISSLLGIARSNAPEPDWRGDVEVKSMAVVRAREGRWRIKDGPALSMSTVDATKKLKRVLWVVRVDEEEVPGSPVLCWYFQEVCGELLRAFEASRHLRPKGGKGAMTKGWYLKPDFFEACGLMRALNGG